MALTEAEELELLELEEEEAAAGKVASPPNPSMSTVEAGLRGAAEGGTAGFWDEIIGAGAAGLNVPGSGVSRRALALAADPNTRRKLLSDYVAVRNEERRKTRKASQDQPDAFMAGEFGGAAASMFVPGMQEATMSKMAALGALQGLGSSEADLTQGDVGGAARDTSIGAGSGMAIHGAMEKVAKPVAGYLVQKGAQAAQKLSGLPDWLARIVKREGPGVFQNTTGTPEALEAANAEIQKIIAKAKDGHISQETAAREIARVKELANIEQSVRGVQDVLKNARADAGKAIQTEKEKLGFQTLGEEAKMIAERGLPPKMDDAEIIREVLGALRPNAPRGKESIEGLVRLRQAIDDRIKFGAKDINPPSSRMEKILQDLRSKINQRIEGPMEGDLERSVMGVPTGARLPDENFGAPLRSAEQEFHRVADITDPLTKKFETVPKGVSTIRAQAAGGLRSIDPEVAALESLSGGGAALQKAESAVSQYDTGEAAFKESLKKFDPLESKFDTAPRGLSTVKTQLQEGLQSVDPDVQVLEGLPGGKEALVKAKNEVARFLVETTDSPPTGTASLVAQTLGLTPRVAAKLMANIGTGSLPEIAARYPGMARVARALQAAAERGPQALATTHFLLQQQDPEYRATINALQEGDQ